MWGQFSTELGTCRVHISNLQHAKMKRRFSGRGALDYIFGENEGEDTERHSDMDEQVSEEEDNTDYHLEDTDTSNESDEEVIGGEAAPAERFKSKNGKIFWSSVPHDVHGREAAASVIKMTPGITRFAVTRVRDIKTCFELFMPLSLKRVIIAMTNLEGRKVHGDMWKDMDEEYLDAYIGVLLLAGVYRSCNEATDSLWDASTGRNIFRVTMSLQTFQMISRVLRFDNRDTRARSDKLAPIRDVWDRWVQLLPLMFNPGPEVTVDKRLVPFRGKCPFRQYIPSKPCKYGIKIWAVCDAKTSYAWNLQIYTGKAANGIPEENQGKRVVLDMTTGLQGHNITCDNFFTSYDLGQELLRRKLTMVGTVKKNKPELPAEILQVKDRAPLSSKFAFTDTTTVVSYCPKKTKNVILMSTLHKDAAVSSGSDKKPTIILDYNKNKGGVDNLDNLTATYTCQRMTRRWPVIVFYNILDVSAYNAFVLWTHIHQGWNSTKQNKRRMFLEELGNSLVKPHIERRERVPRDPDAAAFSAKNTLKVSLFATHASKHTHTHACSCTQRLLLF
ncbi:piggyBac transposable element-derived protein 4-like isoform X2 [Sphaeramia orbicularis]|uniref:piggyBac transposable element-derived protein 4-like isoform X2 n=1 Tax=Sphaeramia orbicularis TaxID=375764 RepID=UPI00118076AD|nr:piggyBac transposable element-derived protein 4-like isoform X2 [Sphaeramia orbicularis]